MRSGKGQRMSKILFAVFPVGGTGVEPCAAVTLPRSVWRSEPSVCSSEDPNYPQHTLELVADCTAEAGMFPTL